MNMENNKRQTSYYKVSASIRELGHKSRAALSTAVQFIKPQGIPITFQGQTGRKWHLFLDQPIEATETCAISCAIVTLAIAGERPDSGLVKEAIQTILPLQLPSGGWTSWVTNLDNVSPSELEEALVIDTYFALRALKYAGYYSSDAYRNGLEWFKRVHNSAEGGWGFFQGDRCHTLPTSYAIRALVNDGQHVDPITRDLINRGIEWLLRVQMVNNNGGWGRTLERPSSATHTALALIALIVAGYDKYSPLVVAGREWLLNHAEDRTDIIDYYVTPGRDSEGKVRNPRAINHINFAEGVILQGALAAGANLLDPRLLSLVESLINLQQCEGYWKSLHAPKEQPIYAIMDACLALHAFSDEVQTHEAVLEVSERIQLHDSELGQLNNKYELLINQTSRIEQTVDEVRKHIESLVNNTGKIGEQVNTLVESHKLLTLRVSNLNIGLFVFRPLMWLTQQIVNYPLLAILVILQLLAYGISAYVGFTQPGSNPSVVWISLIVGILLSVTTGITFWAEFYRKK